MIQTARLLEFWDFVSEIIDLAREVWCPMLDEVGDGAGRTTSTALGECRRTTSTALGECRRTTSSVIPLAASYH
jgi:hypothetical protein